MKVRDILRKLFFRRKSKKVVVSPFEFQPRGRRMLSAGVMPVREEEDDESEGFRFTGRTPPGSKRFVDSVGVDLGPRFLRCEEDEVVTDIAEDEEEVVRPRPMRRRFKYRGIEDEDVRFGDDE